MANYECTARSNYVKIKPELTEEFEKFCGELGWEIQSGKEPDTLCLLNHDGGIPTYRQFNEDGDFLDDEVEVLFGEYSRFLRKDQILHITEQGYEKMRYLNGYGVWIRPDGKYSEVNIHNPPPAIKRYATKHKLTIGDCSY